MASALAEKMDQNFLQCGICLESFQTPRGLPCLHSFCEECLEKWYKTNKKENSRQLLCPTCKQPAEIPVQGIAGFPAHFLVNSLQETVNMEKESYSEKTCSKCHIQDKMANMYCQDCKQFLCESCLDSHKAWEALKYHRMITVEDLTSGKVTLSDTPDIYCAEHDGEQKRFYCETCNRPVCRDCIVMKQCCRDHEYVTLKEASSKKSSHLQEKMKECAQKREQCQAAIAKAMSVTSQLSKSAEDGKTTFQKMKTECKQQLEKVLSKQESEMSNTLIEKSDTLNHINRDLQAGLLEIESACDQCRILTETGSHCDIVSKYTSVLTTLQEAMEIQFDDTDNELGVVLAPVFSCIVYKQWIQSGQFHAPNTADDAVGGPVGIAVTQDLNIVVANLNQVQVYSKCGTLQHIFSLTPSFGEDVAVTPKNNIAYCGYDDGCVLIFNSKNKCVKKIPFTKYGYGYKYVLCVDKNRCIIIACTSGNVDIYKAEDGSLKSSFYLHSAPRSISALSTEEIAVCTIDDTLEMINYSEQNTHTFQPPPDVMTWKPLCVCCSKIYELFVVNQGDPKAICRYTGGGEYMGCITTEINDARGMALSQDGQELFVTEYSDSKVKIFRRP